MQKPENYTDRKGVDVKNDIPYSEAVFPKKYWNVEEILPGIVQAERRQKILYEKTSRYQHIMITEGETFGRALILDGKTQSTEFDEFIYHESLVHPIMITHPKPRTIFLAGGGEGATLREILRHKNVDKIVMTDIDEEVVLASKKFLPKHHMGSFKDHRLQIIFEDSFEYIKQSPETFDVVIIDVPDPLEEGPARSLFTKEFYKVILAKLNPNGIMVSQCGPTNLYSLNECFTPASNTIKSVFPKTYQYHVHIPSFGTTWGFVIGTLGPDPSNINGQKVDDTLLERKINQLKMYDGITHQGLFSTPKYLRESLDTEVRISTIHRPISVR